MNTTIGNIKIPVKGILTIDDEEEIFSILFDLKIADMPDMLRLINKADCSQVIFIKSTDVKCVLALLYRPYFSWRNKSDQTYKLFIAPSLKAIDNLFRERFSDTNDLNERQIITEILSYINSLYNKNPQENTSSDAFRIEE